MKNEIKYEWSIEEVDEHGDIVHSDFSETLNAFSKEQVTENALCIVRNEGNEANGLEGRLWAYVKNFKLPEHFSSAIGEEDGPKVPQKFHKELEAFVKANF